MLKTYFPQKKWQYILALFLFLFLFIVSSFRDDVGTDYSGYKYLIEYYISTGEYQKKFEPGFEVITILVSSISNNSRPFFVITSFLILLFTFLSFYRYSRSLVLSIFLYISTYYYFNSLNGIRQFLAMSLILFFSTKFIVEKKLFKYILSIVFASMFHTSALIMLPAYFLYKKLSLSNILFLLALIPIFFLVYDYIISFIFKVLPFYQGYSDYTSGSANLYILIQLAFIALVLLAYKSRDTWSDVEILSLNFTLLSFFFFILSYKNILFFRVAMYFGIYLMILVPVGLNSFRSTNNKFLFYFICIILGGVNLSFHLYYNVSDVLPFKLNFNE